MLVSWCSIDSYSNNERPLQELRKRHYNCQWQHCKLLFLLLRVPCWFFRNPGLKIVSMGGDSTHYFISLFLTSCQWPLSHNNPSKGHIFLGECMDPHGQLIMYLFQNFLSKIDFLTLHFKSDSNCRDGFGPKILGSGWVIFWLLGFGRVRSNFSGSGNFQF